MPSLDVEIRQQLSVLIGLPLSIARRAADMLILQFGSITEVEGGTRRGEKVVNKGTVGDFALHIQCAWRLEGPDGIITGRNDLYRTAETEDYFDIDDDTCYEVGKNLQDKKLGELLQGRESLTGSYVNVTKLLVVETVDADNFGGVTIGMSGGFRLVLFPSGSKGEDWRFFQPVSSGKHFVVSGSHFEY